MRAKAAVLTAHPDQFTETGISFAGLFAGLRRSWARRRTSIVLADLDDHTLRDIGFEPGRLRRPRTATADWVVHTHSGAERLVFIGR